jgi:hypothetical protein
MFTLWPKAIEIFGHVYMPEFFSPQAVFTLCPKEAKETRKSNRK